MELIDLSESHADALHTERFHWNSRSKELIRFCSDIRVHDTHVAYGI